MTKAVASSWPCFYIYKELYLAFLLGPILDYPIYFIIISHQHPKQILVYSLLYCFFSFKLYSTPIY